jgi:hypothetical protein
LILCLLTLAVAAVLPELHSPRKRDRFVRLECLEALKRPRHQGRIELEATPHELLHVAIAEHRQLLPSLPVTRSGRLRVSVTLRLTSGRHRPKVAGRRRLALDGGFEDRLWDIGHANGG